MTGFFIGGTAALGMSLIFQTLFPRRIPLAERIAPYLGLGVTTHQTFVSSWLARVRAVLTSEPYAPWGTDRQLQDWLRILRSQTLVAEFRQSQVVASGIAMFSSLVWVGLRSAGGNFLNPGFGVLLLLTSGFLGGWYKKWKLNEQSKKVIQQIELQLPPVLELLAFAVAAGEPVLLAMKRVAQTCTGPLVVEIRQLVYSISSGEGLIAGLDTLQKELGSPAVSRATHALSLALERGTPLAQVLRAQASDARANEIRSLLVLAGKKETAMMLPVVFLILPMIVAVALYPGLMALKVL